MNKERHGAGTYHLGLRGRYETLGWVTVLNLMAKEARSLEILGPFPEQVPVQGGKAQAGPVSCQDGPGKAVFVSGWNGRRKMLGREGEAQWKRKECAQGAH